MVYVFLADGFEELEALAPVDMLRRARVDVKTVKVGGDAVPQGKIMKKITEALSAPDAPQMLEANSRNNIRVLADMYESEIKSDGLEMIVLPGGMPGADNLHESERVRELIAHCVSNSIKIGAICAAPSVLARLGWLKGVKATAFPAFRHYLADGGADVGGASVITDGIFTTADGVLSSIDFALELVRVLKGGEWAQAVGTDRPAPE